MPSFPNPHPRLPANLKFSPAPAIAVIGLLFAGLGVFVALRLDASIAAVVNGALGAATAYLVIQYVQDRSRSPESGLSERPANGRKRVVIYDAGTGLLNRWFFERRLTEELLRARRYKLDLSVVSISAPASCEQANTNHLVRQLMKNARAADLPAALGPTEFVIALVHCDAAGAQAFIQRLASTLQEDNCCQFGISSFPDYQGEARTMVAAARRNLFDQTDAA